MNPFELLDSIKISFEVDHHDLCVNDSGILPCKSYYLVGHSDDVDEFQLASLKEINEHSFDSFRSQRITNDLFGS